MPWILEPRQEGYEPFFYDRCPYLYDICQQYGYDFTDLIGEYPIWDEDYRDWLNTEIYNYFEYREIGTESAEMFSKFLQRRMNRIMYRVNSIAAFALSTYDNWDVTALETISATGTSESDTASTTTYGRTNTETRNLASSASTTYGRTDTETKNLASTNASDTETKSTALQSDTPQTRLSSSQSYATAVSETGSTGEASASATETGTDTHAQSGTDTQSGTQTGTDTHAQSGSDTLSASNDTTTEQSSTRTVKGGQAAELAAKWAEIMPDLLGMIFEALENCFMQVY